MASSEHDFDILKRIKARMDHLTPTLPSQLALIVGQFAFKALMDQKQISGDHAKSLLNILHRREIDPKTINAVIDPEFTLMLDTVFEPHYWFDINSHFEKDREFFEALETRIFKYHEEVIAAGSLSEGVASGILPILNSYLNKEGKSTAFLAIFPSMDHSSDALFNAYSSLGMLLLDKSGPIFLLDHTNLDGFIGVDRVGGLLSGGGVVGYLVELFLEKKGLIRDLAKLSKSFKVDLYTALMALGASLEIYENFRNVLDITLEQPMLDFDLSTASLVYVVVRAPLRLQERLPKGYIELEVNSWLKDRIGLDAAQICEPIYVDEFGDRVDVVILVGGFDTKRMFETMDQRISRFDNLIAEHDFYDKETWYRIRNRLVRSHQTEN